jgi:hypothetical protein
MGLELVEYVIAVEDAFELAIPNRDAAQLDTPAKLIDYLCARLESSTDNTPLLQTAFYRLRSALVVELGVSRGDVRPDSTIRDLTTRSEKEVWLAVAARVGVPANILTHAPVAQFLAKMVRAHRRTVGEVARQLAMLRPAALKRPTGAWTRAQVSEVVLQLLEFEIGLTVGPSQLDASFVRDLGMG